MAAYQNPNELSGQPNTFVSQSVHWGTPGHCSEFTGVAQDLLVFKSNVIVKDICYTVLKSLWRGNGCGLIWLQVGKAVPGPTGTHTPFVSPCDYKWNKNIFALNLCGFSFSKIIWWLVSRTLILNKLFGPNYLIKRIVSYLFWSSCTVKNISETKISVNREHLGFSDKTFIYFKIMSFRGLETYLNTQISPSLAAVPTNGYWAPSSELRNSCLFPSDAFKVLQLFGGNVFKVKKKK